MNRENNTRNDVIKDFGLEWKRFDQSDQYFTSKESKIIFNKYFDIFPFDKINTNSIGMDLGCGSGRWAKYMSPKVKKLLLVDPSKEALDVARKNLDRFNNIIYYCNDIDSVPIDNNSLDFAYCLGVLHHLPNTQKAIMKISAKLKKDAPLLLYLYYSLDNRSFIYRNIWKISNIMRMIISNLPIKLKNIVCDLLALIIYLPLAKLSLLLYSIKINCDFLPLSFYKDKSFYTMRTDCLDRFGTKLEKRFSLKEIKKMMEDAGFKNIINNNKEPYWCVVGSKEESFS